MNENNNDKCNTFQTTRNHDVHACVTITSHTTPPRTVCVQMLRLITTNKDNGKRKGKIFGKPRTDKFGFPRVP